MNYTVFNSNWRDRSCYSENIHDYCNFDWRQYPAEQFETLDEAIIRVYQLMDEIGKKCFHPKMLAHMPPEAVTIKTKLTWDCVSTKNKNRIATPELIKKEFKKHPSINITGEVFLWNDHHAFVSTCIQGEKEIVKYLKTPAMKQLQGIVNSLGATANAGGIILKGKKSKK